ncbi:MAG TPA: efflux RND transporter periplasmic adaptor subunit [Burkholderiaceae bacterium]|nr:efflux RND transporter periplasmic adaptor subunit [Burkholderiaceae bacterium]
MLKRRTFWIILLVAAAAAAGAMALKKRPQPAPAAAINATAPATLEFLPGDLTVVQARDLRQTMALTGSLRALNQVAVKARVAGQVREVMVREGAAVSSGQVLLTMDPSEYQARVDQAQGALQAARGQLDIAAKTRDNNQALVAKGFISQNAYTTAASQYEIAQANLDSARGALDAARKSLADTVIRAPLSGLVSSRTVQPGEKVAPDNRLLDIVDLRQLELAAAVPASEIMRIAIGQPVQVGIEGLADPVPGTVVRINPATESGSRSIMTYIRVDNPHGTLRAGMFAEAQLTLADKSGVLTVPQSALQSTAGKPWVYAIEGGKLAQKMVTLGMHGRDEHGAAVEITAGLASGAQIVKTNLGNLPFGTPVRLPQAPAGTTPLADTKSMAVTQ